MVIPAKNLPLYFQNYTVSTSSTDLSVLYSTVAANPSHHRRKRVWNFVLTLQTNDNTDCTSSFSIVYDFHEATPPDSIVMNFEAFPYPAGTFGISGSRELYNAEKYISYAYDPNEKTITFLLRRFPHPLRSNQILSLSLYLHEVSPHCDF